MNKFKKFWIDPVWSKIISAAIIGVALYLWSVIEKVSFIEWLKNLRSHHLEVSYFAIVIFATIILLIILPLFFMKIFSFRLRRSAVPGNLKIGEFNFARFLEGGWICEYRRTKTGWGASEEVQITNGNNYNLDGKLVYVLTEMEVDYAKRKISWTKTKSSNLSKHSKENLIIASEAELIGTDDIGFSIKYKKRE